MAKKLTVAELSAQIEALTTLMQAQGARLDKAARYTKMLEARILTLEEQGVKTKKQLWFLQKVAKGEIIAPKPVATH